MAVVCAMLVGVVNDAGAGEKSSVVLRWNSPEECPDDSEFVLAVEAFLGEKLDAAPEQALSVSVAVNASSDAFSAQLRFRSPNGLEERVLAHPDCAKLMQASALLVALAIDPERVKALQTQEPVTLAPNAPDAAQPSGEPSLAPLSPPSTTDHQSVSRPDAAGGEVPPPRAMRRRLQPQLDVMGVLGAGVLPNWGAGLAARGGVSYGRLQLSVVGHYWIPRGITVPQSSNGAIELRLWTLGVRACALPWTGEWAVRGCVGADAGDMSGTGQGLDGARTSRGVFSAVTAGVSLRYGRYRLAPTAGIEAGWGLSRPPFGVLVDGREAQVFRPAQLSVAGFLGLSYLL